MADGAAALIPHWNSGVSKIVQNLLVTRVSWICARVDKDSDRNPGFESINYLVGDRGILHEPVGNIDPDCLLVDELPQGDAAIFKGGVAEALLGLRSAREGA